jgi:hypothetical protein
MKEYNIQWKVSNLKWIKTDGLVIEVTWSVEVELDGVLKTLTEKTRLRKTSEELIPLEELTEEIVIGWIKDRLGDKNKYHRRIDTIINNLKKEVDKEINSLTTQSLPWN